MKTKTPLSLLLFMVLTIALIGCQPRQPVCVDFEAPLIPGTQYGVPVGQVPGDTAFTINNVLVSVYDFVFTNGGGTFNEAYIDSAPVVFGNGQSIRTNNINLEFDLSGLGFQAAEVVFDYLDLGGFENLSVNGSPVIADDLSAISGPIGGVNFTTSSTPVTGGQIGTATLTGTITTFRVGGQEFWIDNVCASE